MSNEMTFQNYFVCGGNDRERFEKFCKKVFKEHEEHPEVRMEIIIMPLRKETNYGGQ